MLYKLIRTAGQPILESMDFTDFSIFKDEGNREKDLENLLAVSLFEVLYEDARLLPIHQERSMQPEADIYAVNEKGDIVIFELKRGAAGDAAVHQALRYAQDAGKWTYGKIEEKFKKYSNQNLSLNEAHQEAFDLELPLHKRDFNKNQHLIIIGSASDEALVNSVDYWQRQGISIQFLPYRIYEIEGKHYFEFFALPFDRHSNPRTIKGVLFDTNRAYNENSIWDMMEKKRVAAYGSSRGWVSVLNPNDIVFFSHKNYGLIAAARVKGKLQKPNDTDEHGEWFYNVEFLTSVPTRDSPEIKAMPFSKVRDAVGNFFWARIAKVPYLSKKQADDLLVELKIYL